MAAALLIICAAVCGLAGCSPEEFTLENHEWQFEFVQSSESGDVIFCSEEMSGSFPDAGIIDMTATAKDSTLTVTDGQNVMKFAYVVEKAVAGKSTIYEVEDKDGVKGYVSVAMTTYADGGEEYTMIITFEGRAYYFSAPAGSASEVRAV